MDFPNEPLELPRKVVLPEWIDYNGHMNLAFYVMAFDQASDAFFDELGIGEHSARTDRAGPFTVQNHIHYLREVLEGAPLRITLQLLDTDEKRIHAFLSMYHAEEGYLAATQEQVTLFVDLEKRKARAFPEDTQKSLEALKRAHAALPWPPQAGVPIGLTRKSAGEGAKA